MNETNLRLRFLLGLAKRCRERCAETPDGLWWMRVLV